MPVVYACIVPAATSERADASIAEVAAEISTVAIDVAIVVAKAERPAQAIEIGATGPAAGLAEAILRAAAADAIPAVERRLKASAPEPIEHVISGLPRVVIATSRLQPRFHFEFGRVAGRTLGERDERAAVICAVEVAAEDRAGRAFGERYRRAIEAWDVKRLVGLESETRRLAGEDCVAQTAVLMGALSWCRIQPRVLHYDENAGAIVVAIDVLGARRKASHNAE